MNNLWAGSGESLSHYLELNSKFFAKSPSPVELEASPHSLKQSELFGVSESRIGLDLIEKQGENSVLRIHGSTVNAHKWWHSWFPGEVTSYAAIIDAVDILLNTADMKNILVSIDSPGGQVTGIDTASKYLGKLSKKFKVKTHIANLATSAGYWLATGLNAPITASRMAQIGSIGVLAVYTDISNALNTAGVKYHVISAGKEKAYGFHGTEFTAEEKASLQKHVDSANNFFLTQVSTSRNISLSDTDKWAEAQIFYAGEAMTVGLIDKVADLEEVLGSFAASQPTGDMSMLISQEKLAQIFAGASPESVLTPEELAFYTEQNAEAANAEEVVAETSAEEVVAEAPAEPSLDAVKEIGRLEAKLEFAEEKLVAMTTERDALKADVGSLIEVAQASVKNLQIALQQPIETKATASGVLAQFNDLQEMRSERFKIGRNSSAVAETAKPKLASVPNPLRPI